MNNISKTEVESFLFYIEKERGYSSHTIDAYRRDINKFNLFLVSYYGDELIKYNSVDKWAIRNFLGKEEEGGISSKTRRRRLSSIRTFFKFLMINYGLKKNSAMQVSLPIIEKNIPIVIPRESNDPNDSSGKIKIDNMQLLMDQPILKYKNLKAAKKDRKGSYIKMLRNTSILEVFYATGIRLSELVNLNLNSIHINDMILKVLGKGKKERLVPFGKKAGNALSNYIKERGHGWSNQGSIPLFCSWGEKRISNRAVQGILKDYLTQIMRSINIQNPKGTHPHTIRHTFATHLLEADVDIRIIQELLGHSSISSTQIYTKVDTKKLIKIYKESHPHGS